MPPGHARSDHWDLFLESDAQTLWSWSFTDPWEGTTPFTATRQADHRLAYLDYSGPVSGGRGVVQQRMSGTYQTIQQGDDGLPREIVLVPTHHDTGPARTILVPIGTRMKLRPLDASGTSWLVQLRPPPKSQGNCEDI